MSINQAIVIAYVAVVGIGYGIAIHKWREADPDGHLAPLWVILGVIFASGAMWILYGVEVAAVMLLVFAGLGVWQIISYYVAHTQETKKSAAIKKYDEQESRFFSSIGGE